jgi:hypothetical protein
VAFEDPVDTGATGQANWYAANGVGDYAGFGFPANAWQIVG